MSDLRQGTPRGWGNANDLMGGSPPSHSGTTRLHNNSTENSSQNLKLGTSLRSIDRGFPKATPPICDLNLLSSMVGVEFFEKDSFALIHPFLTRYPTFARGTKTNSLP